MADGEKLNVDNIIGRLLEGWFRDIAFGIQA